MRSSTVLLGVQEPQVQHLPAGVDSLDAAEETLELCDYYGLGLDESQRTTLRVGMGVRADGRWAAATMGDAESRQNGKGDTIMAREVGGCVIRAERIGHTAHEFPTANQAFLRLVTLIESNKDLKGRVQRIRYANGEQSVEFRNGGAIYYKARTGGGMRGWDDIATLIYDEAQHVQPEHLAASTATMAINPNSQTWFAGSAGLAFSVKWSELRRDALLKVGGAFGWVEHTAERHEVIDGRIVSIKPDPFEREMWALANPAFGYRISEEFFEQQLRRLGPELFAREHLGVWDPIPTDEQAPAKLPVEAWAATAGGSVPQGGARLAFDVSPNGEWSSIGVALGSLSQPYVELIEHRQGSAWLAARLVELVREHGFVAVGCDATGPASTQLQAVRQAFVEAGFDDRLRALTSAEYRSACGAFFADVLEGRLRRPKIAVPGAVDWLDKAAENAAERLVGDGWVWDRRKASVPVSPLVAVTVARALLAADDRAPLVFAY